MHYLEPVRVEGFRSVLLFRKRAIKNYFSD
jgi:hypothetical protein